MEQIYSVAELRRKDNKFLETYKARLCIAEWDAPTELEKERLHNQILRVNSLLNEYRPMEATC